MSCFWRAQVIAGIVFAYVLAREGLPRVGGSFSFIPEPCPRVALFIPVENHLLPYPLLDHNLRQYSQVRMCAVLTGYKQRTVNVLTCRSCVGSYARTLKKVRLSHLLSLSSENLCLQRSWFLKTGTRLSTRAVTGTDVLTNMTALSSISTRFFFCCLPSISRLLKTNVSKVERGPGRNVTTRESLYLVVKCPFLKHGFFNAVTGQTMFRERSAGRHASAEIQTSRTDCQVGTKLGSSTNTCSLGVPLASIPGRLQPEHSHYHSAKKGFWRGSLPRSMG